ncbi:hypothetical protein V6255_16025 [Psychromonas arctica]|uniref:Uncharacterized protein n=1 Tax=Psychromonas arctica TaxID=168275 RepID=A0ABU9HFQ1_9GAMM
MEGTINNLIQRSVELEEAVSALFELGAHDDSNRIKSSWTMCSVSFEHAQSIKILIGTSNYTSAISIARLQYETLVRSMWIFYAASDLAITKLSNPLTLENEKSANKLPMLSEMIKQLTGKAPDIAVDMLNEFKHYSWKSLSSYVHGGIHAVSRHSNGYPLELLDQIIRMSNGLLTMTAMMVSILTGHNMIVGAVSKIQSEFKDCLPDLKH